MTPWGASVGSAGWTTYAGWSGRSAAANSAVSIRPSESTPIQGQIFEAEVDDRIFTLRLNRVRDRGRGWVLAGFEITDVRKILEIFRQLGSQVTVPRHWAELSPAGGRPRTVLGRLVAWG